MLKYLGFLALFGALVALTPAPASAAADGVRNGEAAVTHDEISSRRYYYRYRYHRPYRYYYRPRYYRPYYRPYRYYRYY
jgi:hypothetical protein